MGSMQSFVLSFKWKKKDWKEEEDQCELKARVNHCKPMLEPIL